MARPKIATPSVPVPLALRIGLYFLLADGVAALFMGDFLDERGAGLVLAILGACLWANVSGWRADGRWLVVRLLVLLTIPAVVLDVLYIAEAVLDGLVRLLLFLVVYKLLTLESVAETRPVVFLTLFMLVAASTSAFGVGFLGVVVAFVGLGAWLALYQHVALEAAPTADRAILGESTIAARPLAALAALSAAGALVLTAGLFIVLPRVGVAALPLRVRLGRMVTGFSDRVELGEYGSILTNEAVVMRAQLPDLAVDPGRLGPLYWRGIALDEFDGRAWSVRHPRRIRLVRPATGGVEVGFLRGSGQVLRQEIMLEPIGSEAVFVLSHALRLRYPGDLLAVDDMGSVTASPPRARMTYTVESEPEALPGRRARRPAPPLDPEATERAFSGGWFHTGDIGVLDEDGYLFIVDRLKDMIVSGGENIAGSEVERVLYEHEAVLEAAVVGRQDERWGEVPVAFVVLRAGQSATADDLIAHCASQLARYKVPKDVTFLEALPRNPSGKVLKRDLRPVA